MQTPFTKQFIIAAVLIVLAIPLSVTGLIILALPLGLVGGFLLIKDMWTKLNQ